MGLKRHPTIRTDNSVGGKQSNLQLGKSTATIIAVHRVLRIHQCVSAAQSAVVPLKTTPTVGLVAPLLPDPNARRIALRDTINALLFSCSGGRFGFLLTEMFKSHIRCLRGFIKA